MPALAAAIPGKPEPAYRKYLSYLPGLVVVALVTVAAVLLQNTELFSKRIPMSSLILAILVGMAAGNILPLPASTRPGIKYASRTILRLAIIFLGFKLSVGQVVGIGPKALISTLAGSTLTILFTLWLGARMGLPTKRNLLLGSGIAVCGAAAVAAVDGVIGGEEEDTAFGISAITLFGTIYIFLYPALRALGGIPDLFYAFWTGSSVHEVAQVAAASAVIPDQLRGLAATTKMIRVLFIVPLTLILSFIPWGESRGSASAHADAARSGSRSRRLSVPWFAILFFVAVIVNSFAPISAGLRNGLVTFDTWIMTAAMAGLGLDIRFKALVKIGYKAALLGAISSAFLSIVSAILILAIGVGH